MVVSTIRELFQQWICYEVIAGLGGRVGCFFFVAVVSSFLAVLSSWLGQTVLDKINSKL